MCVLNCEYWGSFQVGFHVNLHLSVPIQVAGFRRDGLRMAHRESVSLTAPSEIRTWFNMNNASMATMATAWQSVRMTLYIGVKRRKTADYT